MRKPKSFKDFILGILFVTVLGCVAYFIADLLKTEVVPGDIAVQSGDMEITALQRVTAEQRKDGRIRGAICITQSIDPIIRSFTTAVSFSAIRRKAVHTIL